MKNITIIAILSFSILSFSQQFKLPEANVEELKYEIKMSKYEKDAILIYILHNFDSISAKKNISYYQYPDYSICSFNQDFENNINYSEYKCKEAGGLSITLTLPKTERESLIKWIESIFQSSPMDIKHGWNSEKTKFEPIDSGAGCYFEIKETNKNTIVENYCGC